MEIFYYVNIYNKGTLHIKKNNPIRYSKDFKKSIVSIHQEGKSQIQLSKDYGVAPSTIYKRIKIHSEVKIDDGDILTSKQVKQLQKRNALLEEENLILKKAIAIFTPHSKND